MPMLDYCKCLLANLGFNQEICFFFPKKTPSISYKILQMRLLYTNPYRDAIVPSYVDAHCLKKGRMTISGWRLIVVFQLHRICPWGHRISCANVSRSHNANWRSHCFCLVKIGEKIIVFLHMWIFHCYYKLLFGSFGAAFHFSSW